MSYDDDGYGKFDRGWYALVDETYDDEYTFPITSIKSTESSSTINDTQSNNIEKVYEEKYSKIIYDLVSGLSDISKIKEQAIKKIFYLAKDDLILKYALKEKLPYDYVYASKQDDCIRILICNFLKKEAGYTINDEINSEIYELTQRIYLNSSNMIAYDRVGIIQRYLHKKVDDIKGTNAHLEINKHRIRNLLSTARLHLNLFDFSKLNISKLELIFEKSRQSAIKEKDARVPLGINKKYIKNWKVRHKKSLIQLSDSKLGCKFYDILKLDENVSVEEYKKSIINIFSTYNYKLESKILWI